MTIIELLNVIGILVIISGAFLGARGFFTENDFDLMNRTSLSFGNDEHFNSMIFQKYNEIFGFCFIILGSIIQLIASMINFDNEKTFEGIWIYVALLMSTILLNYFLIKITNKITSRRTDLVNMKGYIRNYEISLPEADKKDYVKRNCELTLIEIEKVLKRRFKDFNETEPVKIIDFAKNKFK